MKKQKSSGSLPPLEELQKAFDYEPATGLFRYKVVSKFSSKKVGDIAGGRISRNNKIKYIALQFQRKHYLAHRIAWLFATGEDPGPWLIDHVNGNGLDNRISNLRLCSKAENAHNSKRSSTNTSGYKGVFLCKNGGGWVGCFKCNKKTYRRYGFKTAEDAAAWVREQRAKLHGNFYTHRGDAAMNPQQLDLF